MITRRLANWFNDRLRAASFAHHALNKVFPDDWSFMFGEIAMYSFVILVLSGTFLAMFFEPSTATVVYHGPFRPLVGVPMSEAYASTLRLSFAVRAGLMFRQMHHWAANLFMAAIVVHMMRIFFTGAFRRPRELNWVIGLSLLLLGIFNGFSGYSLPDDLLSGTGLRIAYSIALSVPFVGTWLAFLLFGGEYPAPDILRRLLVLHIFIVPLAIAGLMGAHLSVLWRQKHSQFRGPGRTETNVVGSKLWPTYTAKSLGLFSGIFAVLSFAGGLLQINPIWLYGPYRADLVSSPAQPDWYLGWLEGALRIFPHWEVRAFGHSIPNPFFPAVLLPGATFGILYLWPWIERRFTHDDLEHQLLDRPRDAPLRSAIGVAAFVFYALLLFAGSNDIIALKFRLPVNGVTWFFRIAVVTAPVAAGFVTWTWLRALDRAGAEDLLHVPLWAFRHRSQEEAGRFGTPHEETDRREGPRTATDEREWETAP